MSNDLDFLPDVNSGFLSGDERRNIVRGLLPAFIDRGYNPTQTISILRDQGLGFRESDMRSMYRGVLGYEQDAGRIKFVNRDSVPTDEILRKSDYDFQARYNFIVKATYQNEDNSGFTNKYFGYFTDQKESINAMENKAMNFFSERYNVDSGFLFDFKIVKGFINRTV